MSKNFPQKIDLAELYVSQRGYLMNKLRRKGVRECDLDDVYQDLFAHAAQWAHTYDPSRGASPATWLCWVMLKTVLCARYKRGAVKAAALEISWYALQSEDMGDEAAGVYDSAITGVEDESASPESHAQAAEFERALAVELDDREQWLWERLEGDLSPVPAFAAEEICSDLDLSHTQLERVLKHLRKKVLAISTAHLDEPTRKPRPAAVCTPAAMPIDEPHREEPAPVTVRTPGVAMLLSAEFWVGRQQGDLWSESRVSDPKLHKLPFRPRRPPSPRIPEHLRPVQLDLLAA